MMLETGGCDPSLGAFSWWVQDPMHIVRRGDAAGKEARVVTMPTYDIPPLDQAAQSVFEDLGFRVIPVPGFLSVSASFGSLHCIVKVLDRTEE